MVAAKAFSLDRPAAADYHFSPFRLAHQASVFLVSLARRGGLLDESFIGKQLPQRLRER